jgi:hypothetical protein
MRKSALDAELEELKRVQSRFFGHNCLQMGFVIDRKDKGNVVLLTCKLPEFFVFPPLRLKIRSNYPASSPEYIIDENSLGKHLAGILSN